MDNRAKIKAIQGKYLKREVTREEAMELAQPIIDDINTKGAVIAKKHGKRFHNFTFGYLMR
jgi:hypothetical protein